jgi:hypothetical protein
MLFLHTRNVHAQLRSLRLGYLSLPLFRDSCELERGFRGTNEGSSASRAARNCKHSRQESTFNTWPDGALQILMQGEKPLSDR